MKLRSLIRKLLMEIESTGSSLVQFWVPKLVGDRTLLTTADQPFGFNFIDETLCELRIESMNFKLLGDGDDPGILGHVFQEHITAITPHVKHYTCAEYPHVTDALGAGINSSIACPVFEPSGKCCIGVLEVLSACVPSSTVSISTVIRLIKVILGEKSELRMICMEKRSQRGSRGHKEPCTAVRELLKDLNDLET